MSRQDDNPVERLKWNGVGSASMIDLLAVGFSRNEETAVKGESMARDILRRYEKASALTEGDIQELMNLTGLDRFDIIRAKALVEIGRRSSIAGRGGAEQVDLPEDVFHRLAHLRSEKKEHFVVVLLDAKNQIQRIAPVHIGTVNMSLVGGREVFREAVRDGACSIIVAHNHPSGDPTPSPEDIEVTNKLVQIGEMLDIPVLDHIIIGYDRFTSFSRKGLL
jgi:DNA repair protein RadC